jgi:hypothetical protein
MECTLHTLLRFTSLDFVLPHHFLSLMQELNELMASSVYRLYNSQILSCSNTATINTFVLSEGQRCLRRSHYPLLITYFGRVFMLLSFCLLLYNYLTCFSYGGYSCICQYILSLSSAELSSCNILMHLSSPCLYPIHIHTKYRQCDPPFS